MHRRFKAGVVVAVLCAGTALTLSSTAANASQPRIGHLSVLRTKLDWKSPNFRAISMRPRTGSTITTFTTTITDGTNSYPITMVGKNPFVHQSPSATATIPVKLVPLVIKFSNGDTWNPTKVDSCDTVSAMTRTKDSPIFKSQSWKFGGTSVGTAQYIDAFQRAEFYAYSKTGGINPSYHVKLKVSSASAFTLNVPSADAAFGSAGCGNDLLGAVEVNYMDAQLQNYINALSGSTSELVFFVLHNVVMYDVTPTNCCILGYHGSMTKGGLFQTYGIGMLDNTGDFAGSADISALSHEFGEWVNDPNGGNPTNPWGNVGQVSGCQNNFEVGDPLSGTTITDTLNGFTYHPQELAFFSWFYHSSPNPGVNGWYSSEDTFTTSAAACPPGGP